MDFLGVLSTGSSDINCVSTGLRPPSGLDSRSFSGDRVVVEDEEEDEASGFNSRSPPLFQTLQYHHHRRHHYHLHQLCINAHSVRFRLGSQEDTSCHNQDPPYEAF